MQKPQVIMIAGANGSGKTTAAMTLLSNFIKINEFVNTDAIAFGLSPLNPSSQAIEAGRLMLKRIDNLISQKKSFAFETTASGFVHLRTLAKCKAAGYKVSIIFFYLENTELAIERVKLRVSQGGHNVPTNDIIRRYSKGIKMLLNQYVDMADIVKIYNNTNNQNSDLIAEFETEWKIHKSNMWHKIQGYKNG